MLSKSFPRLLRHAHLVGALVLALSSFAQAQTFGASCDGAEVVPAVATGASGYALVTLNLGNGVVTATGSFTGLSSNCTGIQIHGPASRGANAGVAITVSHPNATSGTFSGSGNLGIPADRIDMLNGLYYVSIQSVMHLNGEIRGQLDLVPSSDCPAALATDPVLSDCGGTSLLGPNIADAFEPYGSSLDCSGAAAPGVYAIQIRQKLAAPVGTALGDLWITGPKLASFSGVHNQNTATIGPIVLPNDMFFVGLSYSAQGFCGGRLSNALLEHIGLP